MAQLNDLVVTGKSRFLNEIQGNVSGTASNVTGTVAIAHGGTGATTRLGAAKNLTDETVPTPGFVVGLTDNWGKFGYTSIANLKTTIGSAAAASGGTAITMCTTGEKYTWNNKSNLTIGTTASTAMAGNTNVNNVTQTMNDSSSSAHKILLSYSAAGTDETNIVYKSTGFTYSPNDHRMIIQHVPSEGHLYYAQYSSSSVNLGYDNKSLNISYSDIEFRASSNPYTWDGTNTSLVTALANKMTNQVQSAQVGISCLESNMMMYKCGRIVYFSIIADFNSTGLPSKVTTNVGSITATDWQPISTCDSGLKGHNNQISMSINSNGTITMYNYTNAALTAGWFRWSCSYITKQ